MVDVSNQDWDLIIAGTFHLQEIIQELAQDYPDKRYVLFDVNVDFEERAYENIYSINYNKTRGVPCWGFGCYGYNFRSTWC